MVKIERLLSDTSLTIRFVYVPGGVSFVSPFGSFLFHGGIAADKCVSFLFHGMVKNEHFWFRFCLSIRFVYVSRARNAFRLCLTGGW